MVGKRSVSGTRDHLLGSPVPLLRLQVVTYFPRDQYIQPALHRMREAGIVTIGDLISKSQREVFKSCRVTPRNQTKLKRLVANFGLKFAA